MRDRVNLRRRRGVLSCVPLFNVSSLSGWGNDGRVWAAESRLQACEGQLDQSISYRPRDAATHSIVRGRTGSRLPRPVLRS